MRRPVLLGLAVLVSVAACGDDTEVKRDAAGGEGGSIIDGGAGTGGGGSGGGGMGGGGGSAGDAGVACPVSSFVTPTAGQVLTPSGGGTGTGADAAVGDGGAGDGGAVVSACPGGNLTYDVKLATSAANGQMVALFAGSAQIATATANGAVVEFKNVMLAQGAQLLRAQVVGVPATCAAAMVSVTVDCMLPTCSITKPVISASHPKLNNVAAPNGDRVSSPGSDYQVAFEVTTNIEDGQPVRLEVAAAATPTAITTISTFASGGKASFPGVTLRPDGDFQLQATCTNRVGQVSRSARGTYPVDTQAPQVTVVSPLEGKFYSPSDLQQMGGKLKVCANTSSSDAVGVPASVPGMGKNLCAGIVPNPASECAAVATGTGGMDCVSLDCLGGAPFDIDVALSDAAGNVSTTRVRGVSCASMLPAVQIVQPLGDTNTYADVSRRLLAANANQSFRDQNANMPGGQTDVVACTDKVGAKARLYVGLVGQTLAQRGQELTTTMAQPGDGCGNLQGVARWTGVTLPESALGMNTELLTATELRVDVTDVSTAVGSSQPTRLWVDPEIPNVSFLTPGTFCRLFESATDVVVQPPIRLVVPAPNVTLTVSGSSGPVQYTPTSWMPNVAEFPAVTLPLGENLITATATDAAGNVGSLVTANCKATVGQIPVVNFLSPAPGSNLCGAAGGTGCVADQDGTTAGWQGVLRARVSLAGNPVTSGSVTFKAGTTELGVAQIDGTGTAELAGVTIPDGEAVTISAKTSEIGSNGTGESLRTVVVDTTPPDVVTALAGAVKDRRQTTYSLTWTVPGDTGGRVTGYVVKVSQTPIDASNFDAAETVAFSGSAGMMGATASIDIPNRVIERRYYMAVAALDAAGNRGPLATVSPDPAVFYRANIAAPNGTTESGFGTSLDGFADLDGDGASDILVGVQNGQQAYLFSGSKGLQNDASLGPTAVFQGAGGTGFGRVVADIGDVDGDGKSDIAVSAFTASRVYIFRGGRLLAGNLPISEADWVLDPGPAYAGTNFGVSLARLGDWDGDGAEEFAIGANGYTVGGASPRPGRVVVVYGKKGALCAAELCDPAELRLTTIDGDAASPNFGGRVLGLGRSGGNGLVATSNGAASAGEVYYFEPLLSPAAITVASKKASIAGPAGSNYNNGVNLFGPQSGFVGVVINNPAALGGVNGFTDLLTGSAAVGPFAGAAWRFQSNAATSSTDRFGQISFGGGFSGTTVVASIVGNESADLVFVPRQLGGDPSATKVYIFDGSRLGATTSPVELATQADVTLALPSNWQGTNTNVRSGLLRDVNGDGYGDFAVVEGGNVNNPTPPPATLTLPGRIVVFF